MPTDLCVSVTNGMFGEQIARYSFLEKEKDRLIIRFLTSRAGLQIGNKILCNLQEDTELFF